MSLLLYLGLQNSVHDILTGADSDDSVRIPRSIECELTNDLVDTCFLGDVVTLTGIVKALNSDNAAGCMWRVVPLDRHFGFYIYVLCLWVLYPYCVFGYSCHFSCISCIIDYSTCLSETIQHNFKFINQLYMKFSESWCEFFTCFVQLTIKPHFFYTSMSRQSRKPIALIVLILELAKMVPLAVPMQWLLQHMISK